MDTHGHSSLLKTKTKNYEKKMKSKSCPRGGMSKSTKYNGVISLFSYITQKEGKVYILLTKHKGKKMKKIANRP